MPGMEFNRGLLQAVTCLPKMIQALKATILQHLKWDQCDSTMTYKSLQHKLTAHCIKIKWFHFHLDAQFRFTVGIID